MTSDTDLTAAPRPPVTWRETRLRLRRDRERLRSVLTAGSGSFLSLLFPAYICVWLHRISHYMHGRRRFRLARFFWNLNLILTGADIGPSAELQGGLVIPHPAGVLIRGSAGRNLTVLAQAGISGGLPDVATGEDPSAAPTLGDDVHISHQAGVHGAVRIGSGVSIAPGCIVTGDVEDHAAVSGPPARIRRRRSGDEPANHTDEGGAA